VVGCSSFAFVARQHRCPSVLRRNRLTPRPSGRLRRRLTQALGSTLGEKIELLVSYAERLAACTALAAGGALVIHFADKLLFGPWAPRVIGALLFFLAFVIIVQVNTDLSVALANHTKNRRASIVTVLIVAPLLQLVCIYFIAAAVLAATSSLSP